METETAARFTSIGALLLFNYRTPIGRYRCKDGPNDGSWKDNGITTF
jgi:hypothetical protein